MKDTSSRWSHEKLFGSVRWPCWFFIFKQLVKQESTCHAMCVSVQPWATARSLRCQPIHLENHDGINLRLTEWRLLQTASKCCYYFAKKERVGGIKLWQLFLLLCSFHFFFPQAEFTQKEFVTKRDYAQKKHKLTLRCTLSSQHQALSPDVLTQEVQTSPLQEDWAFRRRDAAFGVKASLNLSMSTTTTLFVVQRMRSSSHSVRMRLKAWLILLRRSDVAATVQF